MFSIPAQVFIYSLIAAGATALGAVPFFFVKKSFDKHWLGVFNAIASGLMLGASIELILEGLHYDGLFTVLGVIIGIIIIVLAGTILDKTGHVNPEDLLALNAQKMIFIVAVMTVHSFAEGISMGFAFGSSLRFGLLIILAMAIQNIPEGLAVSLVLCPKGVSPWKAAGWSLFTSLPQPIMALPAFLFVSTFKPFLPVGLGFAAGAMIWLIFKELLPEAVEQTSAKTSYSITGVCIMIMLVLGYIFR